MGFPMGIPMGICQSIQHMCFPDRIYALSLSRQDMGEPSSRSLHHGEPVDPGNINTFLIHVGEQGLS